MKQHQYRITIEHIADAQGQPITEEKALTFTAGNHDEIFSIIEKLQANEQLQALDEQQTTAFAVGLKLFSETLLMYPKLPLFRPLRAPFAQFMKQLKSGAPSAAPDNNA